MTADVYSCIGQYPLLLSFRVPFRKPSGTFRDAGVLPPSYGPSSYDPSYGKKVALLTPTGGTTGGTPENTEMGQWPHSSCKLPGAFRKASGKLPVRGGPSLWNIRGFRTIPTSRAK